MVNAIIKQNGKKIAEIECPDGTEVLFDRTAEIIADYVQALMPASLIGYDLDYIPIVIANKIREKFIDKGFIE